MTDTPQTRTDSTRRSSLTQLERREMNQLLALSLFLIATSGIALLGIPSLRDYWLIWSMPVIGLAAGCFALWVKCRF